MELRWLLKTSFVYQPATDSGGAPLYGGGSQRVRVTEKILQYRTQETRDWVDVPTVREPTTEQEGCGE